MNRIVIAIPLLIGLTAASFQLPSGSLPVELSADELAVHNDIMHYGYPGTAELKYRDGYVLSYDGRNRTAHWVAERLNAERLEGDASQSGKSFRQDKSVPPEHRSKNSDYTGSGFDRGHLAAAANHPASDDSIRTTMIYSNASPQEGEDFNRDIWKWLEEDTREWAEHVDELFVFTGPIYREDDPEPDESGQQWVTYRLIGDSRVAVPTHFFKVMLAEVDGQISVQAFVLPNIVIETERDDVDWKDYLVSVDEVERRTGLDFFNVLSDRLQRRLEKSAPPDPWSFDAE